MLSKFKAALRINLLPITAIFLLAFAVRLIYLNQIKTGPLFIPSQATLDEYLYDSWAKEIAFKDPIGKEAFWGLPLYPYFLAFIYLVAGPNVYIAKFIQFFIGALNCLLLYAIGKKIFNKSVGVISGITLALYNAVIFYEGFLVSVVLSIFLICLLILLILHFKERPTYKKSILLGILLGAAALTTPSVFLFIPALIYLFSRNLKHVILSLLFCLIVISPVTIRNYILEKDFIPITAHNGITFYAGNNPISDGTFKLPVYLGTDVNTIRDNSRAIAESSAGRKLKPSRVSAFWFQRGRDFITQNPLAYLKLTFKKFLLFWNHYEVSDIFDMGFFSRFSWVLKLPLVNYAFISAFGLLGLLFSLKQKGKNYLLLQLLLASNLISLMLYFVNTRYRLPAIPVLILFSSYAVYKLYTLILQKRYRLFSCCIAGLAVFYLMGNIKLIEASPEVAYTNLGLFYQNKDMYQEALQEYKRALELNPDYPLAHNNLGIVYKNLGRFDDAVKEYKTAINLNPDYLSPYYNLGVLYISQNHFNEAIENFERALSINPNLVEAHKKIAQCYEAIGNSQKASFHLSKSQK